MIIDPSTKNNDMVNLPQDSPPSYDYATESSSSPVYTDVPAKASPSGQVKGDDAAETQPLIPHPLPHMSSGPSYMPQPVIYTSSSPTVYNYINPLTGEQVVSLLPPNHPEMVCLQAGEHIPYTQYGLLGILAAVFWFPLGIGLCLLDKKVRCTRCGQVIQDGLCS